MARVVQELPPNFNEIVTVFGPLPHTVVFAYGDRIYSPSGTDLSPELVVHEETHLRQQAEVGGPEEWWRRYLADPDFRLAQEVEAYRAQLAAAPNRARRRELWRQVSKDLASSMYGRLVTKDQARELLRVTA